MTSARALGTNVRRKRLEKEWSQEELAQKAGCGRSTISEIESGSGAITLTKIDNLAKALGCASSELIKEDGEQ